jgi:LmbE family N-acetylglucosaminyl deacetylase
LIHRLNVRSLPGPFLVVAPHPDDDVLGTGGLIQVAKSLGKTVYVLYVTAGDANGGSVIHYLHKPLLPQGFRELGYIRHNEAVRAEKFLGVPKSHLFFLGFPDSITYAIVTDSNMDKVHQSPLTKFSKAAYSFAYERNAPYTHRAILQLTKAILEKIRPRTIFVTLRQDTNPDHAAAPILINEAVRQLKKRPQVYYYLIHYPHWPNRTGPLRPPFGLRVKNPVTLLLTGKEMQNKRKAFSFMRSQASPFYRRFFRRNELFWGDRINIWRRRVICT